MSGSVRESRPSTARRPRLPPGGPDADRRPRPPSAAVPEDRSLPLVGPGEAGRGDSRRTPPKAAAATAPRSGVDEAGEGQREREGKAQRDAARALEVVRDGDEDDRRAAPDGEEGVAPAPLHDGGPAHEQQGERGGGERAAHDAEDAAVGRLRRGRRSAPPPPGRARRCRAARCGRSGRGSAGRRDRSGLLEATERHKTSIGPLPAP